jgi:DNA-binding NarL/FixJ family response regulator
MIKRYFHKPRIVIVEDNETVREGFSLILGSVNQYTVVNSYGNCEDMLAKLRKDNPDIVLMDIELPGMSGVEGIEQIRKIDAGIEIIVCSIYENTGLVFKALCAGASGYITKDSSHMELLKGIEEVVKGGAPMSMKIARMVVGSFRINPNSPLSNRETSVLELLAHGKSYSMIAEELFITRETAKSHIKNIYAKLQVNSKSEAISKAMTEKYI